MARRHFMPDMIEAEILPLQNIAPTSGFFTYGEFFTGKKKELLNQTMTIISLSESDSVSLRNPAFVPIEIPIAITPINALIHLVNMTSHEAMEQEALQQAQNRFETLFEKSPDGILLIENDRFIQCNQKMLTMFAYDSEEDFLMLKPLQTFPKRQPDASHSFRTLNEMKVLAAKEGNCQFEFVFKKAMGASFWTDVMMTRMEVNGKDIFYVVCRDISQKKEMELELARQKNIFYYQANHDDLTGLSNRTFFMKEMEKGLREANKFGKELAIMFIDLDRFKKINDSLGHDVGDKVIHIVGERLKRSIRKNDIVARLGGDEFLLMMKDIERYEIS
jgi:PAS domain S-box-containing protein